MKIIIADQMEEEVVKSIGKLGKVEFKPKDLKAAISDADVLIVRSATKVTKELLDHAKQLKVVARAGVGLDNVDAAECEKKGIKVINTPGASTNAVAELIIGVMICMLRNVQKANLQMKNKIWDKKNLTGKEIGGKTLGIVGFGRIGSMVSDKAHALGMNVIAYDPHSRPSDIAKFVDMETLFQNSDVISLHTILTEETKHMINKDTITKMKNGVYIINAARGGLVDEDALYEACKSGKIAGASLDVYETEPYTGKLLELDNIYFTPHLGASTVEAQKRIGEELVEKLKLALK